MQKLKPPICFTLCTLQDEEADTDSEVNTENVTPFAKAGFFSRMSFWWLNPLLKKSKEKILEGKDIPKLWKVDRAETCFLVFMKELSKKEKGTPNPPILSTIFFWQRREILISGLFALVKALALTTAVLVITLTVLGNCPVGKLQYKHLTKLLVSRDSRLKAIAEALTNVKVLKLAKLEADRYLPKNTGGMPSETIQENVLFGSNMNRHRYQEEYVVGALTGKTVLLVTHQVDFLPAFDTILLLSEGKIVEAATYYQLLNSGQQFQNLVKDLAGYDKILVSSDLSVMDLELAFMFTSSIGTIMNRYFSFGILAILT
ncbi:multidrug resistance-associated protein 14 [Actinidia rufa]|uniref:Multidrug resistance-associated protein 14 n=1 Tax=Actinidia rufa TaxID=165716 RepID=A0A7J0FTJ4_9ERIC|nr:multidrug resistance-associated protein 14 [Actinidia rufa]